MRGLLSGTAVTAVAVALLIAVLSRAGSAGPGDPGRVGAQPSGGVAPTIETVTSDPDFFSPASREASVRRLASAYAGSGIEAWIIIQDEPAADRISTPVGWPERYDLDGSPDRDLIVVYGRSPDGQITCCLTRVGTLIERAKSIGYWPVGAWPDRLVAGLGSSDRSQRDLALATFVDGVERMATRVDGLVDDEVQSAAATRVLWAMLFVGVVAIGFALRARRPIEQAALAGATPESGMDLLDSAPPMAADAGEVEPARQIRVGRAGDQRPRDLRGVILIAVAISGLVAVSMVEVVRPAPTPVPMDPDATTVGIAEPGPPVVTSVLIALSMVGMGLSARSLSRRRLAVLMSAAIILTLGGTWSIARSVPATDPDQRSWVAGLGAGPIDRFGPNGWSTAQTFLVDPDEPFTFTSVIRNPGPMPITILGLGHAVRTEPNPYVAEIVGLGWVIQPNGPGRVDRLSGRAEDVSVAWPVNLAPGAELAITFLGRGGPCADPGGTATTLPFGWLPIAYRVAGIERIEMVGLPASVFVTSRTPCSVTLGDRTITYGSPDEAP